MAPLPSWKDRNGPNWTELKWRHQQPETIARNNLQQRFLPQNTSSSLFPSSFGISELTLPIQPKKWWYVFQSNFSEWIIDFFKSWYRVEVFIFFNQFLFFEARNLFFRAALDSNNSVTKGDIVNGNISNFARRQGKWGKRRQLWLAASDVAENC